MTLLALNGPRISEALNADIDDLSAERGHRTLAIVRKGAKHVTILIAPRAGIEERISPHRLRHSFINAAALDAGVPLRDVQQAASHADPRTTICCDRARRSPGRHATYIVSTFIAGATRPG